MVLELARVLEIEKPFAGQPAARIRPFSVELGDSRRALFSLTLVTEGGDEGKIGTIVGIRHPDRLGLDAEFDRQDRCA